MKAKLQLFSGCMCAGAALVPPFDLTTAVLVALGALNLGIVVAANRNQPGA